MVVQFPDMLPVLIALLMAPALAQETAEQRFERLMRDILIIDTHIDTAMYVVDEGYQLVDEHNYYEFDIPRARRGHLGGVFFGIYAQPEDFAPSVWATRALECLDAVHEQARLNSAYMEIAQTADDVVHIHREGKIACMLGLEGGHIIRDSLPLLRDFYRLGVRYMTLTHFKTNDWADSATDTAVHNGLSPFGRKVVREMNRLGMMIDVSHVSDKTFYDVLETSRAPVIASHSSSRALCNIARDMDDDMLRAIRRNGGAVFVNFNAAYLDEKAYRSFVAFRDQRDKEIAEWLGLHTGDPRRWEIKRAIQQRYRAMLPQVDYKAALQHIDHIAKIAGVDHVGIGSDFDGISGMAPAGLEDVSKYPVLIQGLIAMGYSDADIRKIMGENLIRILRANEKLRQ